MSINFPTSLDALSNPASGDTLSAVPHATQHANANDAIEALEAKVGADGSAVTTSHDYKLSGVTGSDKAVSKTGTETLTNKTLTAPKITAGSDAKGDIFQLSDANGTLTRIRATNDGDIISWSDGDDQWESIPNPSASDASTTVKGVAELATLAETLARTTTGGSAKLVVTPDNLTTVLTYDYAVDAVGTDSYAITVTPAPTAYVAGQRFTFKAGTANTGACSLNVNSLGAKSIKKNTLAGSADMETGDIIANQIVTVVYDGTNMQLESHPSSSLPITQTANTDIRDTGWNTVSVVPHTDMGWTFGNTPTYYANGVGISASTLNYAYHDLIGRAGNPAAQLVFGTGTWQVRIKASVMNYVITTANIRSFFGLTEGNGSSNASDITNTTEKRVGLAWYNGALYFVTCNGSATTATNIATRTGTVWDTVTVEFDNTTAKVSLNGTEYTTTSNVPASGNARIAMGGYNSGGATAGISVLGLNISTKLNP